MAFTQKLLSASISLANGNFGSGGNSTNLSGLRMSAEITKAGGKDKGLLELAIFGLPLSTCNQLTTLGTQINFTEQNTITLSAGDINGMTVIFEGTIRVAWLDAQAMPETCFRISAHAGHFESVKPIQPTSIQGSADVAQMMSNLAGQMNLTFENNGVRKKLANPYFPGAGRQQALSIGEHAGISWVIDCGKLAIWPAGQSRNGSVTNISAAAGNMVGYPAFNQSGIIVTALFEPTLDIGQQINVQSDLTPACGTWNIYSLEYQLECFTPHGKWFCVIGANFPSNVVA